MPGIYDMREPVGRSGGPSDPVFSLIEKDCGLPAEWHGTTPYHCWRRLCASVITRPRDQVDGVLRNVSPREIELLAGWRGPPMLWFRSMLKRRKLGKKTKTYFIHNWKTEQQYAAEIPKRKRKAIAAGKASGKARAEKTLFDPHDSQDSHDSSHPLDSSNSPDSHDSHSHREKRRTRSSTPTNRPSNRPAIPTDVSAQYESKPPPDPAAFKLQPETAGITEKKLRTELEDRFAAAIKPKTENEQIIAQILREEHVDRAEIGRVLQLCGKWFCLGGALDVGLRCAVGWLLYALRNKKRSPALYLESIDVGQSPNQDYMDEAKRKIEAQLEWRAKTFHVQHAAAAVGNLGRTNP